MFLVNSLSKKSVTLILKLLLIVSLVLQAVEKKYLLDVGACYDKNLQLLFSSNMKIGNLLQAP